MEEALKRKFGVWAGVRSSSSREYLRDRKIHFLELDFAHHSDSGIVAIYFSCDPAGTGSGYPDMAENRFGI